MNWEWILKWAIDTFYADTQVKTGPSPAGQTGFLSYKEISLPIKHERAFPNELSVDLSGKKKYQVAFHILFRKPSLLWVGNGTESEQQAAAVASSSLWHGPPQGGRAGPGSPGPCHHPGQEQGTGGTRASPRAPGPGHRVPPWAAGTGQGWAGQGRAHGRAGQGGGEPETGPAAASLGQGLTALGGQHGLWAGWGRPQIGQGGACKAYQCPDEGLVIRVSLLLSPAVGAGEQETRGTVCLTEEFGDPGCSELHPSNSSIRQTCSSSSNHGNDESNWVGMSKRPLNYPKQHLRSGY